MLGLRLPAMGLHESRRASLRRLPDQRGYNAEFEPDRADREFEMDPKFLIARDDFEAIIEVRDFETRVLDHVQKHLFTALA